MATLGVEFLRRNLKSKSFEIFFLESNQPRKLEPYSASVDSKLKIMRPRSLMEPQLGRLNFTDMQSKSLKLSSENNQRGKQNLCGSMI